jgi:hypothetical protein
MIYLPILKTKRLIILFLILFCFHISLLSTKHYSSNSHSFSFSNFDENQYASYISIRNTLSEHADLIENTSITYLYQFPQQVFVFIYVSYLFIAIRIILIAKIKTND